MRLQLLVQFGENYGMLCSVIFRLLVYNWNLPTTGICVIGLLSLPYQFLGEVVNCVFRVGVGVTCGTYNNLVLILHSQILDTLATCIA